MSEEDIINLMKTRLWLDVVTTSEYTGDTNGGSLYSDITTIKLLLDDEVISEVRIP